MFQVTVLFMVLTLIQQPFVGMRIVMEMWVYCEGAPSALRGAEAGPRDPLPLWFVSECVSVCVCDVCLRPSLGLMLFLYPHTNKTASSAVSIHRGNNKER